MAWGGVGKPQGGVMAHLAGKRLKRVIRRGCTGGGGILISCGHTNSKIADTTKQCVCCIVGTSSCMMHERSRRWDTRWTSRGKSVSFTTQHTRVPSISSRSHPKVNTSKAWQYTMRDTFFHQMSFVPVLSPKTSRIVLGDWANSVPCIPRYLHYSSLRAHHCVPTKAVTSCNRSVHAQEARPGTSANVAGADDENDTERRVFPTIPYNSSNERLPA